MSALSCFIHPCCSAFVEWGSLPVAVVTVNGEKPSGAVNGEEPLHRHSTA